MSFDAILIVSYVIKQKDQYNLVLQQNVLT